MFKQTSSLDAHAQNSVFDTIDQISRSPSGERIKTVIFITHRLSVARRANKIAMMDNGVMHDIIPTFIDELLTLRSK
jgi:ABC-type bacteriocin/lantibiotic exporter with double-glycine peptidase domain